MFNDKDNESAKNVDDSNTIITTSSGSYNVANKSSPISSSIEEKFISKMFSCSRETLCIFLAVILSITIAALHSAPPKISKPPPAKPFFNKSSIIIDFYKGQLGAMIDKASDSDVSLIMYYAPWDSESQILRKEFEQVAHYYNSQVFFAAINCWHPGSECRKLYNKIQSYPVIILYPKKEPGIQYNGIHEAPYIMRFLEGFLNPIKKISSKQDLIELLIENDSVVVGFFNFKGINVSPGYREFYKAAVQSLQKDPNRDVIFAAVTNVKIASEHFGINHTPAISLYLWNESIIYPQDKSWSADSIIRWMEESTHKVSLWLQPPGVKSSTIAPYLMSGPVLLLFTPRNPFHSTNYYHELVREVALQYYSCENIPSTDKLIEYLRDKRRKDVDQYHQKMKFCSNILSESKTLPTVFPVSLSVQQWINKSCCAKIFMNKCLLCKNEGFFGDKVCSINNLRPLPEICKIKDVFKMVNNDKDYLENENYCCDNFLEAESHKESWSKPINKYSTSMISQENDFRSSIKIRQQFIENDCLKFLAGNKYHNPIFINEPIDNRTMNIKLSSSACDVNRTLAFITIDSLHYFHFSEGLGIDVLKMKDKTAVVILDSEQESQYLMEDSFTLDNLINFINKFTNGSLKRTLRTDSSRRYARDSYSRVKCPEKNPSEICVPELNTQNFLPTILDSTKDVVVMYHSPYCAFCSAISYVYLTVAHLLSQVNQLYFVRIDGDNNDFLWEYTMDRYPSILFFPAKKKDDSTIYPSMLPITIPNLLNFVIANLEMDKQIEALINVCHIGAGEYPGTCISRVRALCLDTIQTYLKKYRRIMRQKNLLPKPDVKNKQREILLKLEHVWNIHLLLGSVEDLKNDKKYMTIFDKYKNYYKNLKLIEKNF
ncbi:thioredoxin domain-containing protein 11 [Chelonus insularis]|uniref:thioredoxin domain-containing protein 11 n=1 Tax=Chelonus insularis TaxID=460826 RepID=UPI00158D7DDB|nr:thioredoxin domain-containing protein 11 [Chelonus insularis]